jgi:2-polyprenyl-6-methoxyphenol hydroxylase-like FAD-dependent oxidoreductase
LRRRYERLSHSPEGFLVFGDALCSFNPIFGQGMTVACMESLALGNCLGNGQQGLAKRFFRATSRLVDVPWQIAVGSDLQNSKVEGKRTVQVRFVNWYIAKFFPGSTVRWRSSDEVSGGRQFDGAARGAHEPGYRAVSL